MSAFRALLWREALELTRRGGQARVGFFVNLVLLLLIGIGAPIAGLLAAGEVGEVPVLITAAALFVSISAFVSMLGPMAGAVDSLAGERERHTLETLLATPVSRGALMAAKAVALALPSVVSVGAAGVAFLVSATVVAGLEGLLVGAAVAVTSPVLAAVAAAFLVGPGLMVSAKARTIKDGQQRLVLIMFPMMMLPGLLTFGMTSSGGIPLASPAVAAAAVLAPVVLIVLSGVAWCVAWARMSRARLIAV